MKGFGRKGRARGSGLIWQQWLLAVLVSVLLLVVACTCGQGGKTPTPTPAPTPTATRTSTPASTPTAGPTPTATPAPVVTPSPGLSPVAKPSPSPLQTASPAAAPAQNPEEIVRDYLAQVLPPGPGREDVFVLCTSCHGIPVIILAGPAMDRAAWESTRYRHDMGMVGWLRVPWEGRQASQDILWEYLIEHFGPDKPPPPPLPEGLGGAWRMY